MPIVLNRGCFYIKTRSTWTDLCIVLQSCIACNFMVLCNIISRKNKVYSNFCPKVYPKSYTQYIA